LKLLNVRHANNNAKRGEQTRGVRWTHTTKRGFGLSKSERLTHSVNNKDKYKKLVVAIIASFIALQGLNTAYAASYSTDHLKLYAHSRILNYKEFQCFNQIITKESRWSYKAKNGSHYGLGQMRSTHYRDLDPYRQIDATLRYITKRYDTPCKAWAFHIQRNYF
jgi:hypothetical protein